MKILIATPLYPPDIAAPAPYVKELATRLAKDHEVTVIAYGHLPEEVVGVRLVSVPKNLSILRRLWRFTRVLRLEAKAADVTLIENGPATELPAALLSLFTRFRYVFHGTDTKSLINIKKYPVRGLIERLAITRAEQLIMCEGYTPHQSTTMRGTVCVPHPPERPEILPFAEYPKAEMSTYETAWKEHLLKLTTLMKS